MLPFYFVKKIPPLRKKLKSMYLDRASQIVPRILSYIPNKAEVIDIGSGTGAISSVIVKKKKVKISLVDVDFNEMCDLYPVIIYDGKKLPFEDNKFTIALLLAVLHHSHDAQAVIDEAIRVSKDKIIVMEDIFNDLPSRIITLIGDCLINWELHSPYRNHSKEEWIKIFEKKNLRVEYVEEFKLWCIGFPFRIAIFVLSKKRYKKPRIK